jgi:hypothetical protein
MRGHPKDVACDPAAVGEYLENRSAALSYRALCAGHAIARGVSPQFRP